MCRSRRELSNEYLLAKVGFDTAETEPLEVWGKLQFILHSPPYLGGAAQREAALRDGRQDDLAVPAELLRSVLERLAVERHGLRSEVNNFE